MIGNTKRCTNVKHEEEKKDPCMYDNIKKAVKIILNFEYLDLTIYPNTAHYGLRFYTAFNRLDAVGKKVPRLIGDRLIALKANITVPSGYTPRFDNTDRETIIPICDLRAVAFVAERCKADNFLRELRRNYKRIKVEDEVCSCNKEILEVLTKHKFNYCEREPIFEIGVRAIDRSNNPIRGKVVAYDSQVVWIQSVATDIPPTFYLVPLDNNISYILPIINDCRD
jgi:hypothetical protein